MNKWSMLGIVMGIIVSLTVVISGFSTNTKEKWADIVITACNGKPTIITINMNPIWKSVEFSCVNTILSKNISKKEKDINI